MWRKEKNTWKHRKVSCSLKYLHWIKWDLPQVINNYSTTWWFHQLLIKKNKTGQKKSILEFKVLFKRERRLFFPEIRIIQKKVGHYGMFENLDLSEKWIEPNNFCSHTIFDCVVFLRVLEESWKVRAVIYPQCVFELEARSESPCRAPDTHTFSWQVLGW